MSEVLETIATPFYAVVDFVLATPVAFVGTAAVAGFAIAMLIGIG